MFRSLGGYASARRVSHKPCLRQAHCFMQGPLRFLHLGFADLDGVGGNFPFFVALFLLFMFFPFALVPFPNAPVLLEPHVHRTKLARRMSWNLLHDECSKLSPVRFVDLYLVGFQKSRQVPTKCLTLTCSEMSRTLLLSESWRKGEWKRSICIKLSELTFQFATNLRQFCARFL